MKLHLNSIRLFYTAHLVNLNAASCDETVIFNAICITAVLKRVGVDDITFIKLQNTIKPMNNESVLGLTAKFLR